MVTRLFSRLAKDQEGATSIEYALIASLIAVATIASATLLGNKIATVFRTIASKF